MPDETGALSLDGSGKPLKGTGPNEPSFNPAAAGSLMGTLELQKAIDTSTGAMNALADQIRELKSSFSSMGTQQSGQGTGKTVGGENGGPHTFGAPMGGNANQYTMNGTPGGGGPGSGPGGGGSQGGGNGGNFSWMGRPNAGGSSNMAGAVLAGGGIRGAAQAFGNMASNNMSNQVALNTYQQYGSYMGGNRQQIATSLLGTGGTNVGAMNMAQSIPDALAMGSTIAQASGSPIAGTSGAGTNPLSRAMYGGAAAASFLNPGMSGQQSAGLAADIFSPMTSWSLRRGGMPSSMIPLSNSGPNKGNPQMNQAQFFGNLNQAMGTQGMSKEQYASFMKTGGLGQYKLSQILPQQDIPAATAAMEAEHGLSLKGWDPNKIQSTLNTAEGGDTAKAKAARKQLAQAGVPTSDVANLQSANAPNASRIADQSKGFTKGLNAVTGTVGRFNTALAHMMKSTGLDKYVGLGAGVVGTTKALEPGLGPNASKAFSMLPRNVRGGGANAPATVPTGPQTQTAPQNGGGAGVKAVQAAESQMGLPYIWGGEQPGKGFDCSGLTQWAYKQAGVDIPRTSQAQWAALQGNSVPLNQVQEGDLVFAAGSDGTVNAPGHVALMVSNTQVIQAAHTGTTIGISGYSAGEWQHAARPQGGGSNNGGTGAGAGSSIVPRQGSKISTGKSFGDHAKGLGDILSGGSTKEKSAFETGVTGGAHGGSGYFGNNNGKYIDLGAASGGTGATPAGQPSTPGKDPGGFGKIKVPAQYAAALKAAAAAAGIPAAIAAAQIQVESSFNPNAVSPAGAQGIAQFMPGTWKSVGAGSPFDANAALTAYGKFMGQLMKQEGGDLTKALAAYNAGAGNLGAGMGYAHQIESMAGLATGGPAAKGQFAWVGERGPELVRFGQDAHVMNADQTAKIAKSAMSQSPQGPFSSGVTTPHAYSPLHPAFSGGRGQAGGHGNQIVLQFDEKAISVNLPTGTTDTGASGRAMAEAFVKQISTTELYRSIATGQKT